MNGTLSWFAVSTALAIGVALVTRQRGWGMALPVLAAGAITGLLPFGPDAPLNPEVALVAVLAPLVFGEALGSSYLDIRRVRRPVLILAIGLVIATTAAIGFAVVAVSAIPLSLALALGAILAPTDAVAVSAVARRASLPRAPASPPRAPSSEFRPGSEAAATPPPWQPRRAMLARPTTSHGRWRQEAPAAARQ